MVVAVSIVLFISAQVLVSFSTLNERTTLDRAAQELAFNIRRAQNMALAVAPVNLGGTLTIPRSIGIRFSSQIPTNYFFFADQNQDGIYNDPAEKIEPLIRFPGNIKINTLTGELVGNPGIHMIFTTPEATLTMTDAVGRLIPNFVDIKIQGVSGALKIVRVRISGQVTVR